jgi:hypothetical protein
MYLWICTYLLIFSYSMFSQLPPLWSTGQSIWLQIQRSEFDSRRYWIFCKIVGLERCSLSPVSTIEELFERKMSGSGLESQKYGHRDPWRWPRINFAKFGTNFTDEQQSLSRHSSLAEFFYMQSVVRLPLAERSQLIDRSFCSRVLQALFYKCVAVVGKYVFYFPIVQG